MYKTTSQIQQKETMISDTVQSIPEAQQQTTPATQPNSDSSGKETISNYASGSLWSNLGYGLGMMAVIVFPPLIPGASVRLLIMGYMFVIVSIYTVAAIVAAMRALRPANASKRGKNTMYYR